MEETVRLTLNGKPVTLTTDTDRSLLWVLRTDLQLTGPKYGCGEGHCGACTVLVNHESLRACQMTVKEVAGKDVITIEGLAQNGTLHPIQKTFVDHDALQCGFCTPGMILTAVGLLHENPHPTVQEITDGMEDNLCRCGAYKHVVQAIVAASEKPQGGTAR